MVRAVPAISVSSQRLVGVDDAFIQFGESPPQCVVEEDLMPMSEPEDAGGLAARPDRLPQPEDGIR